MDEAIPETATTVHYRACNLCEAICGLEITSVGDEVQRIRGDDRDPFSRGHICPKAVALQDVHADPDRLRRPLRRTAEGFEEIGWDEAFDLVAERLGAIRDQHGPDAIATYAGNPSVHNYGTLLFGPRFGRALGSRNRFSATSVDQLPHHLAALLQFGHPLLLPIPDLDRTDFLLVMGANPAVSNGSLMTAPDVKKRIRAIRERGGRVVVVDPRATRTADLADEHHFIRPGQDALLLMALIEAVFAADLAQTGRLHEVTDGIDTVRALAADFPAERVGPAIGIPAPTIRALARAFAEAPTAACYGRLGLSVQTFGATCQWLINVLNLITGNLDRAGGVMFTHPAVDLVGLGWGRGHFGRWHSRVRGLPEFGGELPVAALAEEILTPGDGQVRALVTSAGNPVLSTPNGRQLERAIATLDFMVSIDFYRNETTRHADVILPPTAALEHDHYDLVFNLLAIRNVARYSPPLFTPDPDTRHDWQIYWELERRLGPDEPRMAAERDHLGKVGPRGLLEPMLAAGPYARDGLTLASLEETPHGVDLGALRPAFPERLQTQDQRIDAAPVPMVEDVSRLRDSLAAADVHGNGLVLIGRRSVRSNNSWMHNAPRLMRGADRCTLRMHPDDATRLGLHDRQAVAVRSRVGRIEAPVEITDRIMAGVVSLPHGWGHRGEGLGLRVAATRPGASINDLTDEARLDPVSGNAALSGVPVVVEPLGTEMAEPGA